MNYFYETVTMERQQAIALFLGGVSVGLLFCRFVLDRAAEAWRERSRRRKWLKKRGLTVNDALDIVTKDPFIGAHAQYAKLGLKYYDSYEYETEGPRGPTGPIDGAKF